MSLTGNTPCEGGDHKGTTGASRAASSPGAAVAGSASSGRNQVAASDASTTKATGYRRPLPRQELLRARLGPPCPRHLDLGDHGRDRVGAGQGNEPRRRLAAAGDDDLFSRFDPGDELAEARLGLADLNGERPGCRPATARKTRRTPSIFVALVAPSEDFLEGDRLDRAGIAQGEGLAHEREALGLLVERRELNLTAGTCPRAITTSSPASTRAISSERRALASPMLTVSVMKVPIGEALAACRTEYYSGHGGGRLTRTHAPLARFGCGQAPIGPARGSVGLPVMGRPGTAAPRQAGARTNIRFKFQAMVTRLHSPRTFSSPRSEN